MALTQGQIDAFNARAGELNDDVIAKLLLVRDTILEAANPATHGEIYTPTQGQDLAALAVTVLTTARDALNAIITDLTE